MSGRRAGHQAGHGEGRPGRRDHAERCARSISHLFFLLQAFGTLLRFVCLFCLLLRNNHAPSTTPTPTSRSPSSRELRPPTLPGPAPSQHSRQRVCQATLAAPGAASYCSRRPQGRRPPVAAARPRWRALRRYSGVFGRPLPSPAQAVAQEDRQESQEEDEQLQSLGRHEQWR